MNQYAEVSEQLTGALGLARPPVAVAFSDWSPDSVPRFEGVTPAGCTFWQEGFDRTFVTSAADHAQCAIGIHTHHLAGAPESQPAELEAALRAMTGLDYVRPEEVAAIPVATREARYVTYGPLADAPVVPDVVLLFAHSAQGLVVSEAVQRVDGGMPPAMGRPACAVVPQALESGRAALSLGCCGARAYLDALSDDVALWALPGAKLEAYCAEISTLASANQTLAKFHRRRRQDIEAGERPSVEESLGRLASDA